MTGPVFVDTNVFVYRHDSSDPAKQERAESWIRLLAHARAGRPLARLSCITIPYYSKRGPAKRGPAMKNVTIALPEDLARWLRVKAAEDDRSVSRWIAELLEGRRRQEDEYDAAMPRKLEWPEGRKPTREELYDRPGLR